MVRGLAAVTFESSWRTEPAAAFEGCKQGLAGVFPFPVQLRKVLFVQDDFPRTSINSGRLLRADAGGWTLRS